MMKLRRWTFPTRRFPLLSILVLACLLPIRMPVAAWADASTSGSSPSAVLIVRASPDAKLETRMELTDRRKTETLFAGSRKREVVAPPVGDAYLLWREKGNIVEFRVGNDGILYADNEAIELEGEKRWQLVSELARLRAQHYGEMLPWREVKSLIPRKAVFTVIDLESGLAFDVQRRAGDKHADVQPLTRNDTLIMKQIYGGKWSWQRKAILVKAGNRLIAASMNGMPHGGDGIPDNAFPGHFCIHFRDSATHRSGRVDPEHQLMVHKAAGRLDSLFQHASPSQVIRLFFSALNMGEGEIVKRAFPHADHPQIPFFLNKMGVLTYQYRIEEEAPEDADLLSVEIPVQVRIHGRGKGAEKVQYVFQMKRMSPTDPWKIDFVSMVAPGSIGSSDHMQKGTAWGAQLIAEMVWNMTRPAK